MGKRKTQEEFITDAIKVHNGKYDYSMVIYKGVKNKIKIKCPQNHIFEQSPNDHLNGHGCKKCSGWGKYSTSREELISSLKEVHGEYLDFSNIEYKGFGEKVLVLCPQHGPFNKNVADLLIGKQGCPKCSWVKMGDKYAWNLKIFIDKANLIHNNLYDYSTTKYTNATTKVNIICLKHGSFEQHPKDHINQQQGCPSCSQSKGEILVSKILKELDLDFKSQHTFEGCVNKRKLVFDFYLPQYQICIEFDGIQHSTPIKFFGGLKSFNYIKHNDNIKNIYCNENNITLIRINYNQISKIKQLINKYV